MSASGGQNLAALCTAAGQNLTAVGSGHSCAETVDLGTVALGGLIGTLHFGYTSCKNRLCSTVGRPQQHIVFDYTKSYWGIIAEKMRQVNTFFKNLQIKKQARPKSHLFFMYFRIGVYRAVAPKASPWGEAGKNL